MFISLLYTINATIFDVTFYESFTNFNFMLSDLDLSPKNKKLLMYEVWPVLCVVSSVDDGFRVGGRCKVSSSSKSGVLLGMTHDNKMRVQWDDAAEVR